MVEEKEEVQSNKTNIQISNETWNMLNKLKLRPSETFEDVILRYLDRVLEEGLGIKKQENDEEISEIRDEEIPDEEIPDEQEVEDERS